MNNVSVVDLARRLISVRSDILRRYPFFGRILLRVPFGFSDCETAYTDMKRIVFDPNFASRLDDRQLTFVVMHELMHCVLKHCARARGKLQNIYNIACDIVVNSIILEAMNIKDIQIDGVDAMHLSPDGVEGRKFSAEELYEKLLRNPEGQPEQGMSNVDSHTIWQEVSGDCLAEAVWDGYIKRAVRDAGNGSGIPNSIERFISDINHTPKISWKQLLHDYLQNQTLDYSFSKPDKRYYGDFIMPSFTEDEDNNSIEKVFFFIDTSASVTDDAIAEAFEEIKDAIEQVGNMSGSVLFFDTCVSEPVDFCSVSDIEKMKPVGGGGTRFDIIFEYIHRLNSEELPSVIIIMSDGCSDFPGEEFTLGLPVIWLIIDTDIVPPWGKCIHIKSDEN